MNTKKQVNAPKSVEVDTTKKQNVSRYATRVNTSGGNRLNDKTVVAVNHAVADKVIDTMPTQVQLLIMNIDEITEQLDKCSMLSLNNKWDDRYSYEQDATVVLAHYLSKFNSLGKVNDKGIKNPDTYKGFDKETLLSLFSITAS